VLDDGLRTYWDGVSRLDFARLWKAASSKAVSWVSGIERKQDCSRRAGRQKANTGRLKW